MEKKAESFIKRNKNLVPLIAFDTSTDYLLVSAVGKNVKCDGVSVSMPRSHQEGLFSALEKLVHNLSIKIKDINLIAAGIGPGSYTGIRISVTAAKSLAQVLEIPIMDLDSLKLIAYSYLIEKETITHDEISVINNARRNQFFYSKYKKEGKNLITEVKASILNSRSAREIVNMNYNNQIFVSSEEPEYFEEKTVIPVTLRWESLLYSVFQNISKGKEDRYQFKSWEEVNPFYLRRSYAEERYRE